MRVLTQYLIVLVTFLVACSSVPSIVGPTQTPNVIVVTATPDMAQVTAPTRRTRTPLVPQTLPVGATLAISTPGTTSAPPLTITPFVPPTLSCSANPQSVGKIGLWIYNHIGGNDAVNIRVNNGQPIPVPPKSDKPGQICIDLSPGAYSWSATIFRGGSVTGTISVASGQPSVPINFCLDENGKLTTNCPGTTPLFSTPTPTPCCAKVIPTQHREQVALVQSTRR